MDCGIAVILSWDLAERQHPTASLLPETAHAFCRIVAMGSRPTGGQRPAKAVAGGVNRAEVADLIGRLADKSRVPRERKGRCRRVGCRGIAARRRNADRRACEAARRDERGT
jgi:hypothetical protein